MVYKITAVPKPRMTQRDKWKNPPRPCVARYRAFKDQVKLLGVKLEAGDGITFILPMPMSWSKKKRREMIWEAYLQIPDLDNLLKALFDSVYKKDSHIWHLSGLKKIWGLCGRIIINEAEKEEKP